MRPDPRLRSLERTREFDRKNTSSRLDQRIVNAPLQSKIRPPHRRDKNATPEHFDLPPQQMHDHNRPQRLQDNPDRLPVVHQHEFIGNSDNYPPSENSMKNRKQNYKAGGEPAHLQSHQGRPLYGLQDPLRDGQQGPPQGHQGQPRHAQQGPTPQGHQASPQPGYQRPPHPGQQGPHLHGQQGPLLHVQQYRPQRSRPNDQRDLVYSQQGPLHGQQNDPCSQHGPHPHGHQGPLHGQQGPPPHSRHGPPHHNQKSHPMHGHQARQFNDSKGRPLHDHIGQIFPGQHPSNNQVSSQIHGQEANPCDQGLPRGKPIEEVQQGVSHAQPNSCNRERDQEDQQVGEAEMKDMVQHKKQELHEQSLNLGQLIGSRAPGRKMISNPNSTNDSIENTNPEEPEDYIIEKLERHELKQLKDMEEPEDYIIAGIDEKRKDCEEPEDYIIAKAGVNEERKDCEEPEDYIIANMSPGEKAEQDMTDDKLNCESDKAYSDHLHKIKQSMYSKELKKGSNRLLDNERVNSGMEEWTVSEGSATEGSSTEAFSASSSQRSDDSHRSPSLPLKKRRYKVNMPTKQVDPIHTDTDGDKTELDDSKPVIMGDDMVHDENQCSDKEAGEKGKEKVNSDKIPAENRNQEDSKTDTIELSAEEGNEQTNQQKEKIQREHLPQRFGNPSLVIVEKQRSSRQRREDVMIEKRRKEAIMEKRREEAVEKRREKAMIEKQHEAKIEKQKLREEAMKRRRAQLERTEGEDLYDNVYVIDDELEKDQLKEGMPPRFRGQNHRRGRGGRASTRRGASNHSRMSEINEETRIQQILEKEKQTLEWEDTLHRHLERERREEERRRSLRSRRGRGRRGHIAPSLRQRPSPPHVAGENSDAPHGHIRDRIPPLPHNMQHPRFQRDDLASDNDGGNRPPQFHPRDNGPPNMRDPNNKHGRSRSPVPPHQGGPPGDNHPLPPGVRIPRVPHPHHPDNRLPNMNPDHMHPEEMRPAMHPENMHPNMRPGNMPPNVHPGNMPPNMRPENMRPNIPQENLRPLLHPEHMHPNMHPDNMRPNMHPDNMRPKMHLDNMRPKMHLDNMRPTMHPDNMRPNIHPDNMHPNMHPDNLHPNMHLANIRPNIHPDNMRPNMHPDNIRQNILSLHPGNIQHPNNMPPDKTHPTMQHHMHPAENARPDNMHQDRRFNPPPNVHADGNHGQELQPFNQQHDIPPLSPPPHMVQQQLASMFAPPPINQINVNKLLTDLLSMGIIPGKKEVPEMSTTPAADSNEAIPVADSKPGNSQDTVKQNDPASSTNNNATITASISTVKEEIAGTAVAVSTDKPNERPHSPFDDELLHLDLDPDANLPSIDFTCDLKLRHDEIIKRLYTGIQCSACGFRFTTRQTDLYAEHLDWHYRLNRKDKEGAVAAHRELYSTAGEWICYEEDEDATVRNPFIEELETGEEQILMQMDSTVPLTGNAGEDVCYVCKEAFETFYNETEDEWQFANCMKVADNNFHPSCYEDHSLATSSLVTPVKSMLYNPFFNSTEVVPGLDMVQHELRDSAVKLESDATESVIKAEPEELQSSIKCEPEVIQYLIKVEPKEAHSIKLDPDKIQSPITYDPQELEPQEVPLIEIAPQEMQTSLEVELEEAHFSANVASEDEMKVINAYSDHGAARVTSPIKSDDSFASGDPPNASEKEEGMEDMNHDQPASCTPSSQDECTQQSVQPVLDTGHEASETIRSEATSDLVMTSSSGDTAEDVEVDTPSPPAAVGILSSTVPRSEPASPVAPDT